MNHVQESLDNSSNDELYRLRLRFRQAYDQCRAGSSTDEKELMDSYASLVSEMRKRRLPLKAHGIDRRLFWIQAHEHSICLNDSSEHHNIRAKHERIVRIIAKSSDDERIAVGIVYEPDEMDAHGDYSTEDEIRKAAWNFMESGQVFKVNHQGVPIAAQVLESYIAPADFLLSDEVVKKGTWILTTRVLDDEIWSKIKSGCVTGYSMAGTALVADA